MEIVSVKFQEDILKKIDKSIAKHHYNSRTEFIREAVRTKLTELEKSDLIKQFMSLKGSIKQKSRPEDDEKDREEFGRKLFADYEKRFGKL